MNRSLLTQSGMKIITGWARALPIAAKEMPVLPLVTSMIGLPALRIPLA